MKRLYILLLSTSAIFLLCSLTACVEDFKCLREGEIIRAESGCVSYCWETDWIEACPNEHQNLCEVDIGTHSINCSCDPKLGSCEDEK